MPKTHTRPTGRKSLVQIDLAGRLLPAYDRPEALTEHEWTLLTMHVNDGMSIGQLADIEGTAWPKMKEVLFRLGAIMARQLALSTSSLYTLPIDVPTWRSHNVSRRDKQPLPAAKAESIHSAGNATGRRCLVSTVTLVSKFEDLSGCTLTIQLPDGSEIPFAGFSRDAARAFDVGHAYNLYLG